MFETVRNPYLKDHCVNFSFKEELATSFKCIAEQKYSHTPIVLTYDFSSKEYQRIIFEILSSCNSGIGYKEIGWLAYWGDKVIDYSCGIGEKEAYDAAIKIIEKNEIEINRKFGLEFSHEQLSLF